MRSVLLVGLSPLVLLACSKEDPIAPTASILSPQDGETYYADQKILFEGLITDDVESPNELSVVWKSDIDGELDWANEPDSRGRISGHGYLTEGDHSISLTATDTDGLIGRDSLLLTIGPNNSAPSCDITAPPEGTATNEGDAVTLVAQVDDVDVGPLELSLSWASDLAGDLGSSTADLNGLSSLEVEGLEIGTHTVTLTVADEMGLECQAQIQHKIGQAPRLTWQAPDAEAILSSESPGYAVLLVEDDAHAAEDLAILWESSLDGSLSPDPIDSEGLSQRTLEDLSLGTHVLTAIATNPDDLSGTASLTLTVNGVPEAPSVVILPDPSTTTNDLTAVVTEGADPEGDAQTFLYQWSKDGVLDSSVTGDVVPNTATAKGEEWTVRVTPNDGYGSGPLGEASIVVANTAPAVSTVSISPANPTVSDTLVCSYGYADDDSDADASTIEWTVGSTVVGTGASLAGSSLSKADVVTCTVTANDGEEDGNSVSDSVTVLNSEPVLSNVSISPATGVTTSSTLNCSATATDADGEAPTLSYAWTNGSTSIGSGSTLTLSNTTSSPTDTITCTATATDGSSASVSDTASVTVENTLPVVDTVSISPTNPTITDTVTCSATASDADGDTPTLSYAWTDGTNSLGTSASLDLSTSGLAKGSSIICEVTATDDQGDTDTESDTVAITNSVPTVSSVAISPTSPTVNDALTCSYTFADNDSDADASTIAWTVGSTTLGTGATLAAGSAIKNEAVTCTVTPNDGTDTGTAVSDTVTVINTAPVVSAVSISPTSPTVSDALTCSYSFADDDSDADASSVTWTVGSTTLGTGSTLSAGSATKGETVVCTVEADDGEDTGNTATSNVNIENSAPTAPVISIDPSDPVPGRDDLICLVDIASSDDDNDSITYSFDWELDGSTWTGSTSTTTYSDDTISAVDVGNLEEWTCTVTPNDGDTNGSSASASVTPTQPCTSLYFDGNSSDISVPQNTALLLGSGDFTIEYSAYIGSSCGATSGTACAAVAHVDGGGNKNKWGFFYSMEGYYPGIEGMFFHSNDTGGNDHWLFGTNDSGGFTERWSKYALVRSGNSLLLFVNGELISTETYTGTIPSPSAALTIGSAESWFYFDGYIDDMRLSSTARYTSDYTPQDVLSSDSDTIAFWNFDDGSGTTLTDASGNGHHGTINGPTWATSCAEEDLDGDGFAAWEDCDDSNHLVHDSNGVSKACASQSCKAILDDGLSTGDGPYWIDPDGTGDAELVSCDMTTDGGGWTQIFLATNTNYASKTLAYTYDNLSLRTEASEVLMTFVDSTGAVTGSYATFDIPTKWVTAAPFTYAGEIETIDVYMDGATTGSTESIHYGYGNDTYGNCANHSFPNTNPWGRICIEKTSAAQWGGWAYSGTDYCTKSSQDVRAQACHANTLFSLYVR